MTMSPLPVVSPSQPPAEGAARAADAGASDNAGAFSKVLSQQGQAVKGQNPAARQVAAAQDEKPHDPLDPDSTLALILDSAALPLMQAPQTAQLTGAAQAASGVHAAVSGAQAAGGDLAQLSGIATVPLPLPAGVSPAQTGSEAKAIVAVAAGADGRASAGLQPGATPLAPPTAAPTEGAATALPAAAAAAASAGKGRPDISATLHATPPAAPELSPAASATSLSATSLHTADAADADGALPGGVAAGASLLSPAATSLPSSPTITLAVPAPLGSPQWAQDLGRQMVTLTQSGLNGTHTVQLHVNPPDLGPVHITLQIGDASTQAAFVSPHAHVRQALENALPSLEQQFAQAGLSLGQANVSDQQAGQQGFAQSSGTPHSSGNGSFGLETSAVGSAALAPQPAAPLKHPDALVDTFV